MCFRNVPVIYDLVDLGKVTDNTISSLEMAAVALDQLLMLCASFAMAFTCSDTKPV